MLGSLQAIHTILPLSFTAGINLYLTILVVGLSIRAGWVPHAPEGLHVLASLPVLVAAAIFYVLEFCADKIPFVDNVWDLIHTFVRPAGSILLTVVSLTGMELDPQIEMIAVLAAGAVALTAHSGKAGTRTVVNVSSPAENISNIAISLLEDAAVAVIALLSFMFPVVANIITIIALVLIVVFVPQLLRWAWFTLHALWTRLKAVVAKVRTSERLPAEHRALLDNEQPLLTVRCRAQNVRGANARSGYLSLLDQSLAFTYNRWIGGSHIWRVQRGQITALRLQQRVLMVLLVVDYTDDKHRSKVARFVCTQDRLPLVEQFIEQTTGATAAAT